MRQLLPALLAGLLLATTASADNTCDLANTLQDGVEVSNVLDFIENVDFFAYTSAQDGALSVTLNVPFSASTPICVFTEAELGAATDAAIPPRQCP